MTSPAETATGLAGGRAGASDSARDATASNACRTLWADADAREEASFNASLAEGLQALVDRLRPEISLIENPAGANMLRSFGHLMNQYSAAYYGYLWAEVLSADMFATCFELCGNLSVI